MHPQLHPLNRAPSATRPHPCSQPHPWPTSSPPLPAPPHIRPASCLAPLTLDRRHVIASSSHRVASTCPAPRPFSSPSLLFILLRASRPLSGARCHLGSQVSPETPPHTCDTNASASQLPLRACAVSYTPSTVRPQLHALSHTPSAVCSQLRTLGRALSATCPRPCAPSCAPSAVRSQPCALGRALSVAHPRLCALSHAPDDDDATTTTATTWRRRRRQRDHDGDNATTTTPPPLRLTSPSGARCRPGSQVSSETPPHTCDTRHLTLVY